MFEVQTVSELDAYIERPREIPVKLLGSEIDYENRWLKIRSDLYDRGEEKPSQFFIVERPDWVNVVAITPDRRAHILLEYKYGVQSWRPTLPGGMLEPGEEPCAAAARELVEECGLTTVRAVSLGSSPVNPATHSNTGHFVLCFCDQVKVAASPQRDEHMITVSVPFDNLVEYASLSSGKLSAYDVAAIFRATRALKA